MIALKNIAYRIGKTEILSEMSLAFAENKFNVILGPNGAGKSTLLKMATGVLSPSSGMVFFCEKNIATFSAKDLSLHRAVLSQQFEPAFPLTVQEVVMMGRYPYFANTPTLRDKLIVEKTLTQVSMSHKTNQMYTTLSGGEKQKVQMARVLSQIWQDADAPSHKYLFLDEPTSGLDIRHQLQILDLAQSLLPHNVTVIAVLHDLNLSFQYGTHFFILNQGKLVFETDKKENISEALIQSVYNVKAKKILSEGNALWRFGLQETV